VATLKLTPQAKHQREQRDPLRKPVRAATAPRVHTGQGPKRADEQAAAKRRPPPRLEPDSTPARPGRTHAVARSNLDPGERLTKVMAERGIASRREADAWIEAGWVLVNGLPATLGQRVSPSARIEVAAQAQREQRARVTVLYHKPLDIVSGQAEDDHTPAVAMIARGSRWSQCRVDQAFHDTMRNGLAPAGRLDIDSTGLLVLTQDGRIARELIGEDSEVEKEYVVHVDTRDPWSLSETALAKLRHGLSLDTVALRPARVHRIDPGPAQALHGVLGLVLQEGRKRQIRRMCELVGLRVTQLQRVRIGRVDLGDLPLGAWRFLRDDERFS
jgi:23S rRNA pseudouridine2604 synthase